MLGQLPEKKRPRRLLSVVGGERQGPVEMRHTRVLADKPRSSQVLVPFEEGDVFDAVPSLQRCPEGYGRKASSNTGKLAVTHGLVGELNHRVVALVFVGGFEAAEHRG